MTDQEFRRLVDRLPGLFWKAFLCYVVVGLAFDYVLQALHP